MRKSVVIAACLAAVPSVTFAAEPAAGHAAMELYATAANLKWAPVPPSLPKGAEFAVLSGDPGKEGLFTVRLRLPANYHVPAHHHPGVEAVTVLSGHFHAGMGDKLDTAKSTAFEPGGFVAMPAGMNHFAWTSEPAVIQVSGMGPFQIDYVNPADDPRK